MSNALNIGGMPASMEQQFSAPAVPWTPVYWGGPPSMLFEAGPAVYVYAGSGGLVLAGVAGLSRTKAYTPGGGVVFGGAAPVARVRSFTPVGGIVFGGAASLARVRAFPAGGPIVFVGASTTTFEPGATTYTYTPEGGIVFSGDALTEFAQAGQGTGRWIAAHAQALAAAQREAVLLEDEEEFLLTGRT